MPASAKLFMYGKVTFPTNLSKEGAALCCMCESPTNKLFSWYM